MICHGRSTASAVKGNLLMILCLSLLLLPLSESRWINNNGFSTSWLSKVVKGLLDNNKVDRNEINDGFPIIFRGGSAANDSSDNASQNNMSDDIPQGNDHSNYDPLLDGVSDDQYHQPTPENTCNDTSFVSGDLKSKLDDSIINGSRRTRHASDVIEDILPKDVTANNNESIELRLLIRRRTDEYINDILQQSATDQKITHPKKLLHFLAPKIPAIKHSPDVNLRIRSSSSDMDSGLAACIIASLAQACEVYDKLVNHHDAINNNEKRIPSALDIMSDRRFEQLIECLLLGVSVQKRKMESISQRLERNSEETSDIDKILDDENAQQDIGLSVQDACRAAWGISVLGVHHVDSIADETVNDLLVALSLRSRELLLAKLQLLRHDDLLADSNESKETFEDRLNLVAKLLSEEASSSIWAFACVKACTGIGSGPLIEVCCSILCQDPIDLRKRAQDAEPGLNNTNIGANDVVDKLARLEAEGDTNDVNDEDDKSNSTLQIDTKPSFGDKDAILDWLSPNEVNDILWSLALHGNDNTLSSREAATLSETASALREIAFDRLLDWLREDIYTLENPVQFWLDPEPEQILQAEEVMTVEVVDAAALLASSTEFDDYDSATPPTELPVENITVKIEKQEDLENEYPDSVTFTKVQEEIQGNSEPTFVPLPQYEEHKAIETDRVTETQQNSNTADYTNSNTLIFSSHDLCSMAWSVTDLQDPLRFSIMELISDIILKVGKVMLIDLKGGDLSNLAWAICKYDEEGRENINTLTSHVPSKSSQTILQWITEITLSKKLQSHGRPTNLLDTFQPPELGRLVWALASTFPHSSNVEIDLKMKANLISLVSQSLLEAASYLDNFATEDLARVCWAYLEICDMSDEMTNRNVLFSLGKVMTAVEVSVHRWERGLGEEKNSEVEPHQQGTDASVFSSFFGRSRSRTKLLDQRIDNLEDDVDVAMAPFLEKSHRPKLGDLTIDPSTMCKVACGFSRLANNRQFAATSWTITRVALRLFSAKDGRLLNECSIHDLVRLCEATVHAETAHQGSELVIGLFARRALKVLNEELNREENSSSRTSLQWTTASPDELSTLIWSLGCLGVRHVLYFEDDDEKKLAHRRMKLVTEKPILTKEQLSTLSDESVMKLFHGLVAMSFQSQEHLLDVLLELQQRLPNIAYISESNLCEVAESLATLRQSLKLSESPTSSSSSTQPPQQRKSETKETESVTPDNDVENDISAMDESQNNEIEIDAVNNDTAPSVAATVKLYELCNEMLFETASRGATVAQRLKVEGLRRLLTVYTLLPFQVDNLVDIIEAEVIDRESFRRTESYRRTKIEEFVDAAATNCRMLKKSFMGDDDSDNEDSIVGSIRNGFKSLFGSSDSNKIDSDMLPAGLEEVLIRATNATRNAKEILDGIAKTSPSYLSNSLHQLDDVTSFELGRCRELIANYRRIEFSTGTLRSRYDKQRAQDTTKRVLSRLLP